MILNYISFTQKVVLQGFAGYVCTETFAPAMHTTTHRSFAKTSIVCLPLANVVTSKFSIKLLTHLRHFVCIGKVRKDIIETKSDTLARFGKQYITLRCTIAYNEPHKQSKI